MGELFYNIHNFFKSSISGRQWTVGDLTFQAMYWFTWAHWAIQSIVCPKKEKKEEEEEEEEAEARVHGRNQREFETCDRQR